VKRGLKILFIIVISLFLQASIFEQYSGFVDPVNGEKHSLLSNHQYAVGGNEITNKLYLPFVV